jgi:hypothetical protein
MVGGKTNQPKEIFHATKRLFLFFWNLKKQPKKGVNKFLKIEETYSYVWDIWNIFGKAYSHWPCLA